jgi:hypothetical protein
MDPTGNASGCTIQQEASRWGSPTSCSRALPNDITNAEGMTAADALSGIEKFSHFMRQRIFFLHDGRTRDLREAIQAHQSPANGQFPASEARTC